MLRFGLKEPIVSVRKRGFSVPVQKETCVERRGNYFRLNVNYS